ncbi:MAG: ATP-binding protein [Pseudomonadota bacterium]|nr:ATP-binding protein [Pseudomonadota bacterium]
MEPKSSVTGDAPSTADRDSSSRGPRPLVKAWAAALLLHTLAIPTGRLSEPAAALINDAAWTIAATLAAVSSLRAALSVQGRERLGWLSFAMACVAWAAGQMVLNVHQVYLGVAAPSPSYADIGYLAFGLLMILGLFVLRTTQQERRMTWLRVANLGLILCSLAAVLITTFARSFLDPQRSPGVSLVVGENALIVVGFVIAVYFLWSYRWGDRLLSYGLIALALGAQMITGLLYTRQLIIGDYGPLSFFNAGWMVAFALHQWAAEAQVSIKTGGREASMRMRQGQGWVEALVPSFLLLCFAVSAVVVTDELTERTVNLRILALVVFAVILASREAWLHWRGLQLRGALDSSAQALEVTARAGRVGLWEWDLSTNEVHFSREYKRQLGYAEHELADDVEEWQSRLHPQEYARIMAQLAAFIRNPHGELVSEQRLKHRDGSYRWMLVQGSMSFDATGRPVRMMGSLVDITQFKHLEQSLRESEGRYRDLADALEGRVMQRTRELSNAYRESQNFAYAVAHDLKAPLRAINGFCALLEQSATERLTDTERDYVRRARQGAMRLAGLIDDLLAYSRVEHREQRLVAINCQTFVTALVASMAEAVREAGAEVRIELDSTAVMVDSEGLRIIMSNLLENALKFSRRAEQPRIVVDSRIDSGRYLMAVRDNGIGFEPAYSDKIFEIFNRLHASGYEGTGIGLALVRKAVQRMGGEVWAESLPGAGATFYVSLNIAEDDTVSVEPAAGTS